MYKQEMVDAWKNTYSNIKDIISKRLEEFSLVWMSEDDERLFAEFIFCHLTPQSRAKTAWEAVKCLMKYGYLLYGNIDEIRSCLTGVRFRNKKAHYILLSRNKYWYYNYGFRKFLLDIGLPDDVHSAREYLVKYVKGMGYKEASHFLRNIGFGKDIAILDRHILKNLALVGAIPEVPKSLTKKRYMEIEDKMRQLSVDIGIPLDHLDLLLWYLEAGEVFK